MGPITIILKSNLRAFSLLFSIVLVASLLMLLMTSCEGADESSLASATMTLSLSQTLIPGATVSPVSTVTSFPVISSTHTPLFTPSPVPTLAPYTPSSMHLTNEEVVYLLFDYRYPNLRDCTLEQWRVLAIDRFGGINQQRVDLDGDEELEIVVHNANDTFEPYIAILDYNSRVWEVSLYANRNGHYCGYTQATVEANQVVVDFLTCGGGTGIIGLSWEQSWIQCQESGCAIVWSATLLSTIRGVNTYANRTYDVSEILQSDPHTIQLTTRHFSVSDIPVNELAPLSPHMAHRVVGPDTIEIFRWDGSAYRSISRTQGARGMVVSREFDFLTNETRNLVYHILVRPFQEVSENSVALVDPEGYNAAKADFWGLPLSNEEEIDWGTVEEIPVVALHNGTAEELGEWIAGIVGAENRALCRLTVQRHSDGIFLLSGRIDVPCIEDFTSLAWVDVTGDGEDELFLRTIPPYEDTYKTGASYQRLHIYTVGDEVIELAVLDGELNGSDGEGVRWEDLDGDGTVEILLGLPLLDIEDREFPDTLARRFRILRWDSESREFVEGGIWIAGGPD